MKYFVPFILQFFVSLNGYSLTPGIEVGCDTHRNSRQLAEIAICENKLFPNLSDAEKYFGGKITEHPSLKPSIRKWVDLNGDGSEEYFVAINDGGHTKWVVLLREDATYRAIANFTGAEMKVHSLPSELATQLNIDVDWYRKFKYIWITSSHVGGATYSAYAYNGHRYNFIGGWSWESVGLISKEDME